MHRTSAWARRKTQRSLRGLTAGWLSLVEHPLHHFLTAGFDLSCFGFMLFLSFFCELLPLPMFPLPSVCVKVRARDRPPAGHSDYSIGTIAIRVQF
jgi:hypothetical protein